MPQNGRMAAKSKRTAWTAKRRQRFLDRLAETGNVSTAAALIGCSRSGVYEQRNNDPEFSAAWDVALEVAADALEAEARRRALDGVEEPVFHRGETCGYVRKYSDTLLIFLLKGVRPEKFRERSSVEHSGGIKVGLEVLLDEIAANPEPMPYESTETEEDGE